MENSNRLQKAYQLIDQANAEDPNSELVDGKEVAKELIYGHRMTETLAHFEPNASEALKLAVRAQHICRWQIPRESYPMDKKGYLKWRANLKKFHADKASSILAQVGYQMETIERVSFLLQKKQLKKDDGTQTLEDVACLVFLTYYFEEFIAKHEDAKVTDIIRKTWNKMSDKGHKAALKINFSSKEKELVQAALP
ncbi:DUF4202 domain-containing protein [Aquimarina sp. ERC-38]|uniref:DUF4202 domain-containing protein n=1 Tax=Aquimarina sp. ERC-38 TaxID=2949996 RepID=UPI0022461D37|nr:DUF4202 domain-containing protein [Aquimarina sp. ERC-38]UZO80025.1 DUF4202 domain-containing protein [Aquimarina sp. ERC-38]